MIGFSVAERTSLQTRGCNGCRSASRDIQGPRPPQCGQSDRGTLNLRLETPFLQCRCRPNGGDPDARQWTGLDIRVCTKKSLSPSAAHAEFAQAGFQCVRVPAGTRRPYCWSAAPPNPCARPPRPSATTGSSTHPSRPVRVRPAGPHYHRRLESGSLGMLQWKPLERGDSRPTCAPQVRKSVAVSCAARATGAPGM